MIFNNATPYQNVVCAFIAQSIFMSKLKHSIEHCSELHPPALPLHLDPPDRVEEHLLRGLQVRRHAARPRQLSLLAPGPQCRLSKVEILY